MARGRCRIPDIGAQVLDAVLDAVGALVAAGDSGEVSGPVLALATEEALEGRGFSLHGGVGKTPV